MTRSPVSYISISVGLLRPGKIRRIHHYRTVFYKQTVIYEIPVTIVHLPPYLVAARVTAPKLVPHLVTALGHLKTVLRLCGRTYLSFKIFVADIEKDLIIIVRVVPYHQIDMRIGTGRAAGKRLRAV